jgi:hypothetical protein
MDFMWTHAISFGIGIGVGIVFVWYIEWRVEVEEIKRKEERKKWRHKR